MHTIQVEKENMWRQPDRLRARRSTIYVESPLTPIKKKKKRREQESESDYNSVDDILTSDEETQFTQVPPPPQVTATNASDDDEIIPCSQEHYIASRYKKAEQPKILFTISHKGKKLSVCES